MPQGDSQAPSQPDLFSTTHWSIVLGTQDSDSLPASVALASLCETYWYPLYVFVRSRGYSAHDAQDLTQAFFEKLLEKNYLASVSQEKGRFRAFLLASIKHFLSNERDRANAAKRGGGKRILSLDEADAESRYRMEPADSMSAERLFDRRWAVTVLDEVLSRLRVEMETAGKRDLFEALKDLLSTGVAGAPYAEIGQQLQISEGAARAAAHRLKKRYREILREEIGRTVNEASAIDEEIRHLISVLSTSNSK